MSFPLTDPTTQVLKVDLGLLFAPSLALFVGPALTTIVIVGSRNAVVERLNRTSLRNELTESPLNIRTLGLTLVLSQLRGPDPIVKLEHEGTIQSRIDELNGHNARESEGLEEFDYVCSDLSPTI